LFGRKEQPPPPPPAPEPEAKRYAPEPVLPEEKELRGTSHRVRRDDIPSRIWIDSRSHDTSEFDRKHIRIKDYEFQSDAIKYAKKIAVPTIVFRDQDGLWQVAIDYP
jgi:hypothetical protein